MKFLAINPSVTKIVDPEIKQRLKREPIKEKNMSVEYRIKQLNDNLKNATYNGNIYYSKRLMAEIDELKKSLWRPISWEENGEVFIRTGYLPYLTSEVKLSVEKEPAIEYQYELPRPRPYPYSKPLKFEPYEYQKRAVELLLQRRHATVESATGTGKTLIIIMLAQKLGLKTIVITPFVSIFQQILKEFEYYFGKGSVGTYGAGKKTNPNANFVIAVSDSIANVTKDHPDYNYFQQFQVAIFDEAHTLSAETLEAMSFVPLENVPYRYFLTGTHTRPDGLENLLCSITGPVVMRYKTKDAVRDGFICPFKVNVIDVETTRGYIRNPKDAIEVKRAKFLYNPNISDIIAANITSNIIAPDTKRSALVLVSELRQIYLLYVSLNKHLAAINSNKTFFDIVAVASSANSKEAIVKAMLPDEMRRKFSKKRGSAFLSVIKDSNLLTEDEWKFVDYVYGQDVEKAVEDFNKGDKRVLVGTSVISTGVNIFPTHFTFNWQGGSSEIVCKQGAIGRSVRRLELSPYKEYHDPKPFSLIIDFNVREEPILYSMLRKRLAFYED